MGKADLHIHTVHSDGIGTVAAVLETARRAGLDLIAITDHDTLESAATARDLAPQYGIGVIPGVEISTAEGHLLAYWVDRPVPAGRNLIETLQRIGDQGGVAVAAHPYGAYLPSLKAPSVWRALNHREAGPVLVGIEVFNGGLPRLTDNEMAQALAVATGLAPLANSDSHMLWTIGRWSTAFPGKSADAFRWALKHKHTIPLVQTRSRIYVPSWLVHKAVNLAGFAFCGGAPGAPIRLRRISAVQ